MRLFRSILLGTLIGAALFFAPFGFGFLFFIFFFFIISRIFFWRSWRRGYGPRGYYAPWQREIISIDGRDAYVNETAGAQERRINIH
jgi:hypothetical protein